MSIANPPFSRVVLAAAVVLSLGYASANAQSSSASATLSFNVVASSPTALTWLAADSFSSSNASSAAFAGWSPTGFGEFAPTFNTPVTDSATTLGLWRQSSSALAADGLNFSSSFTFSPTTRQASLQTTSTIDQGGFGSGDAFVRSHFSLAPGASVTFTGGLTLSVFGTNQAFTPDYITTDLYGSATGLMSIGGFAEDSRTIGNAALPYTAGNYAFNEAQTLSVSMTNNTASAMNGYFEAGVGVYSVSAVPEPGNYAMLLAGLACVGLVAHRRRRG
jgi:hypothetical protein